MSTTNFFKSKNDNEIVALFNREVGSTAWVSARGNYLGELRKEFIRRAIDFTIVSNYSGGFNLNKKVRLVDKVLVFI
ncbi:hypothetical protein [Zhouia amylolytica]|uniref:Uncharacterized protein n=1 Tax=Zhouia amylolytica AD3 TaxID=1286632 RepID=W2UJZ8_9FLAO|nr:hypothetical protein [Zhouia amylolytica]ETN94299.1 hypothetical protein P278_28000 [Zhouia amylolytica AD3]